MTRLRPSIPVLRRSNRKISLKDYVGASLVLGILGQYLLEDKGIAKFLTGYVFALFVSLLYILRPSCFWGHWEQKHVSIPETGDLSRRNADDDDGVAMRDPEDTYLSSAGTSKPSSKPDSSRLHYLDNIKVFLTFLVVLNHTADAFGCCGQLSWMMVIGNYKTSFKFIIRRLMIFNQSCFMCLFFFISGYFTVSSYKRKGGEAFIQGRINRLLVPAWASFFVLNPMTFFLAQWTANSDLVYFPSLVSTWFIYWLLFFEWIYVLFQKEKQGTSTQSGNIPFPNSWKRWMWGLVVCGLAQCIVSVNLGISYFYGMPLGSPGSLLSDILLFTAGTIAGEYEWISPEVTITEQLDIAPWKLRLIVCFEGILVMYLKFNSASQLGKLVYFLAAGMLCVDVSVAYLQFFQENANQSWSYLSDGAYIVYLIHPLITQACTSAFYKIYDKLYPGTIQFDPAVFDIFVPSTSHLQGPGDGSVDLWIGFLVVLIVSNAILWPLSYYLRKLPILNRYL